MSESLGPVPVPQQPPKSVDRLDSWKEIAAYLGREVRTVQLWEKNEGLPVHRHQHARQGSVYAFRSELDAWRKARRNVPETAELPVVVESTNTQAGRRQRNIAVGAVIGVLALAGFAFWRIRSSVADIPTSVVVLPFLDLSQLKDQEYFSDGLTEEIIDALSRVPHLRVVARTSAFAFKGKAYDIRHIGRELNVNTVLEGSVRKSGDQLRITAQLNRVSDGTHLWSRTFDRQLRDVFTVQQEISQSIADQLRAGQVPRREPTTDLDAYTLYQEGRYFFNQGLPAYYPRAVERYQQAIRRDPKFALAYAGLADAYAYQAEHFVVAPKEAMPKAREAAEKAIALDENLGEAHASLGIVMLDYELDRNAAQREFRRAMQLNPGSGYLHHWYAHSLEAQGQIGEALEEMRASLALDPLAVIIHWDIANELLIARRYDEALKHLEKSLELFPNHPLLLYFEAWTYHVRGDAQAAHRVMESFKKAVAGATGQPFNMTVFGIEAAWDGRQADARQILAELERLRTVQYVDSIIVTFLCSALGDRDNLRVWFQRAYEERAPLLVYAPIMEGIYFTAGDPEVDALIAKIR